MDAQKEFAQKGLQWRIADAKKAGIHPLAAIGASTHSAAPAMVGGSPMIHEGDSMSAMGQDIGRAIASHTTNHQRKMMDLQLENAKMDNEFKQMELVSARRRLSGQVGPGIPDDVINKPAEVTSHAKGRRNIEAGSVTSTGYARGAGGILTPVPSKDVKERIEDQFIPETVWSAQNYLGPTFGSTSNKPPKKEWVKGAKDYQWSVSKGAWEPVFKGKGRTPWKRFKDWVRGKQKKRGKSGRW